MMSKVLSSLIIAGMLVSGVASAASLTETVEPQEGETLAQFQSSNFPQIDRREIRVSEGSGELNLKEAFLLAQQERVAIHFVNDTDQNVQIDLPEINATFMVPKKTDRIYEFEANEIGYNNEVPYTVTALGTGEATYIAQNAELVRIANEQIVIPTFADETEVSYQRSSHYQEKSGTTNVRGYW